MVILYYFILSVFSVSFISTKPVPVSSLSVLVSPVLLLQGVNCMAGPKDGRSCQPFRNHIKYQRAFEEHTIANTKMLFKCNFLRQNVVSTNWNKNIVIWERCSHAPSTSSILLIICIAICSRPDWFVYGAHQTITELFMHEALR